MADIWLTHDPEDARGGAVAFIAAEMERAGAAVKLDPRHLRPGPQPLWRQVSGYVINPRRVGAWCFYITEETLAAGETAAEIAGAARLARQLRKERLPVAIICPGSLPPELISPELRSLGLVQMTSQYWVEQLRAAVEERRPEIPPPGLPPYALTLHDWGRGHGRGQALEIRSKLGTWSPFVAGVPAAERDEVSPRVLAGPRGRVPTAEPPVEVEERLSADGDWWMLQVTSPVERGSSYFLLHSQMPGKILFGAAGGTPQFVVRLRPVR